MANTKIQSLKERLGILGVGLTANFLIVNLFDYVLYPAVIWHFGLVLGAAVMWAMSFAICYATIVFYDWSKQDWLGIETLKEVREATTDGGIFKRFLRWALNKGDFLAMVALSINFDPFICTVYMRQGAHQYNGMGRRDWKIFVASFIIANAWWTIAVFSGLSVLEWIVEAVRRAL